MNQQFSELIAALGESRTTDQFRISMAQAEQFKNRAAGMKLTEYSILAGAAIYYSVILNSSTNQLVINEIDAWLNANTSPKIETMVKKLERM